MRLAVLLLVLFSLLALPHGANAALISGGISRWCSTVVEEWGFAYELLRPQVPITTFGATSPQAIAGVTAGTIDFGAILSTLTQAQRDAGLRQFPITAAQTVVIYNLNNTIPANSLNLTNDALCDIWTGRITQWDDPRITAANPAMLGIAALAGRNLTVVYRSDTNGGTSTFTGLMAQMNCGSWNATFGSANVFSKFPSIVTTLPNWVGAGETIGACGYVGGTPWTISFAEQSWSITHDPLLPTAKLQGPAGGFTSPYDVTATTNAIDSVVLNNVTNTANIAVLPGDDVYPFLSFAYILVNTTYTVDDCAPQREVFKFFRWALLDPDAQDIARDAGAISLPPLVRETVVNQFNNLECDGARLLRTIEIKQHTGAGFPILLAFSMLFWALALVVIGAAWYVGSRSKNPLFYAVCLAAGTSLAFCSLIFFYLVPSDTWICQLRQWFLCLGLTLLFGVMFARGWQLHVLHTKRESTNVVGKKDIVTTKSLMLIMGILVGVQLIILICWSAIDKLHSSLKFSNTIDLETRYICRSKITVLWLVLELVYFIGLLAWGMYVVYRTWKSRAAVDSRWTLIAVYNTLMVFLIIIPLLATVAKTDDWVFYVAVIGTDFSIMSAISSIYGSVLLRRLWDRVSGSGSGSSKEGKVSTFRTSMSGEGTIA